MKIDEITPQIAAMYLGQKATVKGAEFDAFVADLTISTITLNDLEYELIEITPHLRRIESITEQEARELYKLVKGKDWKTRHPWMKPEHTDLLCVDSWFEAPDERWTENKSLLIGNPTAWLYLLSKGFDLFNLIESGLAKEVTP